MSTRRNQRALSVIRSLRRRQYKQNQQIGVLCQDMVQAHGEFSRKISRLSFVTAFYEALLSASNIESLLDTAAAAISTRISEVNVAIFVLEKNGFDIHCVKNPESSPVSLEQIESWFTARSARDISLSGQVCSVNRMLALGMIANPKHLKEISVAAVPLGTLGQASGFVMLWRGADRPFSKGELETVVSVSSGLRGAMESFSKTDAAAVKTVGE